MKSPDTLTLITILVLWRRSHIAYNFHLSPNSLTMIGYNTLSLVLLSVCLGIFVAFYRPSGQLLPSSVPKQQTIQDVQMLAGKHEVAAALYNLIQTDGAGAWPPRANHSRSSWPEALRPYKEVYLQMSSLLASTPTSQEDSVNMLRMKAFRKTFQNLLDESIDLSQVIGLLEAADAGRWDLFPREPSRWSIIPVVKVAQLEVSVDLPAQLVEPWNYLQRYFGCTSQSGNNMSNIVLNFDCDGNYVNHINIGLPELIVSSEETFARVFYEVERTALPIYYHMVKAIMSFEQADKTMCVFHMRHITSQLRIVLNSYYDRVHPQKIALSAWLSHVQGFYAWGVGHTDEVGGHSVRFDGLSGNQALLFQVVDAFCGLEKYLDESTRDRNVPRRQRELCETLEKHCFRRKLGVTSVDASIVHEFLEILKRLRDTCKNISITTRSRKIAYDSREITVEIRYATEFGVPR
ncbi:hypothetical protein HJFPF1_05810 [Paramyrothecium foliicola]|nr:hypothetical protein HJFPF1_05810 [Paramyrothecium foliicola]